MPRSGFEMLVAAWLADHVPDPFCVIDTYRRKYGWEHVCQMHQKAAAELILDAALSATIGSHMPVQL